MFTLRDAAGPVGGTRAAAGVFGEAAAWACATCGFLRIVGAEVVDLIGALVVSLSALLLVFSTKEALKARRSAREGLSFLGEAGIAFSVAVRAATGVATGSLPFCLLLRFSSCFEVLCWAGAGAISRLVPRLRFGAGPRPRSRCNIPLAMLTFPRLRSDVGADEPGRAFSGGALSLDAEASLLRALTASL